MCDEWPESFFFCAFSEEYWFLIYIIIINI